MRLIPRIILLTFSNSLALLVANYYISGFYINTGIINLLCLAFIFSLINVFIKPIIKIILSPFILLSFGLAIIIINAGLIYFLDFLSADITINGLKPLIESTILISLINIIISYSARSAYKKQ